MSHVPISVLVHTLDEERVIEQCLESVRWAEEVLVVDMESEDRTVELARRHADRVLSHAPTGYVEPARMFAVESARHEWVLIVDADEMVPRRLRDRLREIADGNLADAVYVPHTNHIFGRPMRGTGWGPERDRHLRFFRRGCVTLSPEIHALPRPAEDCRILRLSERDGSMVHFGYDDPEDFVARLNRYTTVEAQNRLEGLKREEGGFRTLVAMLKESLGRFFFMGGYRDGWRGVTLSATMAFYRLVTYMKVRYLEEMGQSSAREIYEEVAREILAEYQEETSEPYIPPDPYTRS